MVEGYYPLTCMGLLTSVVLKPGWISSVDIVQENSYEMNKFHELGAFVENDEFEFRNVVEICIFYCQFNQYTQLVVSIYGGSRQLMLEELDDSKLAGHLGIRMTVVVL